MSVRELQDALKGTDPEAEVFVNKNTPRNFSWSDPRRWIQPAKKHPRSVIDVKRTISGVALVVEEV